MTRSLGEISRPQRLQRLTTNILCSEGRVITGQFENLFFKIKDSPVVVMPAVDLAFTRETRDFTVQDDIANDTLETWDMESLIPRKQEELVKNTSTASSANIVACICNTFRCLTVQRCPGLRRRRVFVLIRIVVGIGEVGWKRRKVRRNCCHDMHLDWDGFCEWSLLIHNFVSLDDDDSFVGFLFLNIVWQRFGDEFWWKRTSSNLLLSIGSDDICQGVWNYIHFCWIIHFIIDDSFGWFLTLVKTNILLFHLRKHSRKLASLETWSLVFSSWSLFQRCFSIETDAKARLKLEERLTRERSSFARRLKPSFNLKLKEGRPSSLSLYWIPILLPLPSLLICWFKVKGIDQHRESTSDNFVTVFRSSRRRLKSRQSNYACVCKRYPKDYGYHSWEDFVSHDSLNKVKCWVNRRLLKEGTCQREG